MCRLTLRAPMLLSWVDVNASVYPIFQHLFKAARLSWTSDWKMLTQHLTSKSLGKWRDSFRGPVHLFIEVVSAGKKFEKFYRWSWNVARRALLSTLEYGHPGYTKNKAVSKGERAAAADSGESQLVESSAITSLSWLAALVQTRGLISSRTPSSLALYLLIISSSSSSLYSLIISLSSSSSIIMWEIHRYSITWAEVHW